MNLSDKLNHLEGLLADRRFDEAVTTCREILAADPDNPRALIAMGQSARAIGDHAGALAHFQAAAERLPGDIWRKLDVVVDLVTLERFSEANAICHDVLSIEPGNLQALIALGQSARAVGDHAGALVHFQAVAERLPDDIWRKLDVADNLLALKQFPEAMAICHEILSIDPSNPQALIGLGQTARAAGNHVDALACFQAAAAQLPDDIWRKLDVVEDLLALKRFPEASTICRDVLAIAPGNPQALIALGQAARAMGDRTAALAHFEAVAKQLPNDVWHKFDIVEDLMSMDRFADVETVCREILFIDPRNPRAFIVLSKTARRAGDHGAALAYLRAASAQLPQDIYLKLAIIGDLLAKGRADDATLLYQDLLTLEPVTSPMMQEGGSSILIERVKKAE